MTNPLIDLKDLSAPLTKLVEVVANGIGALYAPIGTVRQARADEAARIIHAKGDAEIATIEQRVASRLQHREALRQVNSETVVAIAADEMPDSVSSKPVDPDWTLQFFDAAQDVCDEDMQKLWARILAGEVSEPGSYSKRTLQFLKTMDRKEAEGFTNVCGYAFRTPNWHTIVEESFTRTVMQESLGEIDWLRHFVSIGLLNANSKPINASAFTGKSIRYFDQSYVFDGPSPPEAEGVIASLELHATMRDFSRIGQELARIAGAKPVAGYAVKLDAHLRESIQVSLSRQETS